MEINRNELEKFLINEETNEITIVFCSKFDKSAKSKIIFKTEKIVIDKAENSTYL